MKKYSILIFLFLKSFVLCAMNDENSDCWNPSLLDHLLVQTAGIIEPEKVENKKYVWFCPECCPGGVFETSPKRQSGVFKVMDYDSQTARRHCRQEHGNEELFTEGIFRNFPNGHYAKDNGNRNEAKGFLQELFGANQRITEADFKREGMGKLQTLNL